MGTKNRARRAAKQRARAQHAGRARNAHRGGADAGSNADDRLLAELARGELLFAARRVGAFPPAGVDALVAGVFAARARIVDTAAGELVGEIVAALFAGGWTPVDLAEVARRRLDAAGESYLLDAVAATARCYAPATLHPQWRAYLGQTGAELWWRADTPHLTQWQERHRLARTASLATVVKVLAMLHLLPVLEEVVPAPGTHGWTVGTAEPVDERMLAKVRALLAKAEATEFDEEAEALSAKAQELMTRYSLHRAVADQSRGARQVASVRRIWLDAPYVSAKAMLVSAVAEVNRCRCVITEQLGFVTIIGDEVDQRVVEILSTSLLVQATRAITAAGSQLSRYGTSRTRSFRQSFLIAYAGRIGERLREGTASAMAAEDSAQLLPVLAARSRAVEERFAELFPCLVSKKVSISNGDGWRAGRAAADLARLDVHASLRDSATERAG